LDGKDIPFEQVGDASGQEAVLVDPGRHTIGYRFEPDTTWIWLRRISWTVLATGAVVSMACFTLRGKAKRHLK
jgi:hypothetical protein